MRLLITNPILLRETATMMLTKLPPSNTYDYVAGVVAGGVPLAVMLSQLTGKPMLMIRSERKAHGTGKLIEGVTINANRGLRVLLVEDVVSTFASLSKWFAGLIFFFIRHRWINTGNLCKNQIRMCKH